MTTPELTRSSRYESVAGVSTGIRISFDLGCASALLIVLFLRGGVIYLHLGLRLQSAQSLVAADDDLVTRLQSLCNLYVRDTSNSGLNRPEQSLFPVYHEYALDFVLLRFARCWRRRCCQSHTGATLFLCILGRFFQILARSHCQSLNGNRHDVFPFRRFDLGSR